MNFVTFDNGIEMDILEPRKAAMVFRAFNHKLRLEMLKFCAGKSATVSEIFVRFRIEQSVASQHLSILRHANLVKTQREGKYIFYSTNNKMLKSVQQAAALLLSAQKDNYEQQK